MIGLDEGIGFFDVAATDAAEDLIDEIESTLLGRIIRKEEAGIGLDDADGGEFWQI